MTPLNFVLLYVDHPPASAAFYERLLEKPPVEMSDTFAMFPAGEGLMLGLWSRRMVTPAAAEAPGAAEIAFAVANDAAVHATHARWSAEGVAIAQPPTRLDFGLTFVGLDLDGHRLRVFAPPA